MKWFIATTETGTEYKHTDYSGSVVQIIPGPGAGGYPDAIKGRMVVIPAEVVAKWYDEKEIDWEWISNAPDADVPIIGQHIYVGGFRAWRISTPIVKIEEK